MKKPVNTSKWGAATAAKRYADGGPVAKDSLGRTIPAEFIPPKTWERAKRDNAPIVRSDSYTGSIQDEINIARARANKGMK